MDILQSKPLVAIYCPFSRHSKDLKTTETCNKLCGKFTEGSSGEIRCRRCYKIFEFRIEDGKVITEKTSPESVKAEQITLPDNYVYVHGKQALSVAPAPPSEESEACQ